MDLVASTSYPLLAAFWTMLWFVGFFLWIWLAILVFSDIFRSHDMSGWLKALWVVTVFIFPLLGVLLYLIVRGHAMREHAEQAAAKQDAEAQRYIKSVVSDGGPSTADEIAKLAALRDSGALSQAEFDSEKARLLA